ncbi:MAG: hypothetical protein MJ219_03775 [Mycoplasmoidaceae bacterium]|nr:hypothetical protein [Mycoplasmoidaceae bacterium]
MHVEEETGSDDVITATIKFDKTVITDYSKDIVIQFSVDPLDYENVTINNQAFVDSEGLKANVIQKTYGSDVKINYKIDSNY